MPTAGTRLGSKEVLALFGQGRMCEVYQTHDTKLGRDVLILGGRRWVMPVALS